MTELSVLMNIRGTHMHMFYFTVANVSLSLQYADPVADLLDKHEAFSCRLFRESCVFHKGNYVKVSSVSLTWWLMGCDKVFSSSFV